SSAASDVYKRQIPGRLNNSADIVAKLLVLQGKATDEEAAHKLAVTMPPSEIISFLKTMPALSLIRTYQTNPTEKMFPIPAVIRDGFTIPDVEPEVLLADRSTYNAVPGILGTNRDEMKMGQLFNSELVGKNLIGLPFMKDQERYVSASRYKANIWKYVGADKPASLMVGSGQKDIFVFRFDWDEQPTYLGRDLGAFIGASHTMEIPFIFGQFQNREIPKYFLTKENAMGRESLSRTMRGYWAEFARTGKPGRGSGNAPNWKPWNLNAGEAATLLLDTPEGGDVRMAPARVNFAELQAELIADETHAPNEKCSILSLLTLTGAWTVQDLNAATGGTC
ncbi:MAG: carboxylesterase family protein, partial [Kordiimonadaceae bacterium]|nr:carboxylesterase family protein [Kordiimonadaceae bacterium]